MVIKKPDDLGGDKVNDESTYINRRALIRSAIFVASVAATAGIYRAINPSLRRSGSPPQDDQLATLLPTTQPQGAATAPSDMSSAFRTNEPKTPLDAVTHYNNFYEFSLDKEGPAEMAQDFVTRPWTVAVGGLCAKPKTFDIDDLLKIAPAEERIYRMRCVEAWSMVIPWVGFPLAKLLEQVEPRSSAKYVAFTTLLDPRRMPGQRSASLNWPYVEGLRIDEAMHPLAILASGLYGKQLPPQNGAPLRLVVPWKYGFKGIKSIVKIDLVDKQPPTTWNQEAANEYGFYANVNPMVDHPRWSQASENRIGVGRRETLMFNGYAEQVAHLYAGMDLAKYY